MKEYNILQPIFWSFFSKGLYRDVAQNWRGNAFLYLFILLAICWIPAAYLMHQGINSFLNSRIIVSVVEQMPIIKIHNGEVSIDQPSPHFIRDPQSNKILAIIDTSGQITSLAKTRALVLLTKDKLYVRRSAKEVRVYDLKRVDNREITKTFLYHILNFAKAWGVVLLYPILLIVSYLYRIMQALLYALFGMLVFAKITKASLNYQQLLRLSIIAVTPAIILGTVFNFFSIIFPYQWTTYFVMTLLYLFFAIRVNSRVNSEVDSGVESDGE